MGATYHRHHGGNHPHLHRHDDRRVSHYDDAGSHHRHEERDCPRHHHHHHGDHVYDIHGQEPAIVNGDPNTLGHWHFDSPFKHVALAPLFDFAEQLDSTVAAFASGGVSYPPQAARPPPDLIQ